MAAKTESLIHYQFNVNEYKTIHMGMTAGADLAHGAIGGQGDGTDAMSIGNVQIGPMAIAFEMPHF